uniref:GDP-fucose protein O-fucosyltransferase 1 n=2 Tax=Ciona intestinalis TaxID=7719 RepID=F6PLX9_CIOIN
SNRTMRLRFYILTFVLHILTFSGAAEIDENGYIAYCPCMGRFGNQADHFLGSLSFAKKLNRTLIIPPWIVHGYRGYGDDSFIPYSRWFQVNALKPYHRVIEMKEFMLEIAPSIWLPEKRYIYCHESTFKRSEDKKSCPAKSGNPFGPFWDNFKIDFPASEGFPTHLHFHSSKKEWDSVYPATSHPVLAFMGAPASYPVNEKDKQLQRYVQWTKDLENSAGKLIDLKLKKPYVGIHFRNGMDWKKACDHVKNGLDYPFMSSPQCTGYQRSTSKRFTYEMCYPSLNTVKSHVLSLVKESNSNSLFIATDASSYENEFNNMFKEAGLDVSIVKLENDELMMDLALLIESDRFIGSCGSSVTAFVSRKREVLGRPNEYFGASDKHNEADRSEL